MAVEAIVGFDGSCPHYEEGVKQAGSSHFIFYPSFRKIKGIDEEAPGKGSRFHVLFKNTSLQPATVKCTVDWEKIARVKYHDIAFTKHESACDWLMIPGCIDGSKVIYDIKIEPGLTNLGLFPAYNYGQYEAFIGNCRKSGLRTTLVGKSRENRNIWLLTIPSGNPNAGNVFIQARDHSYETAGSYCVEGIVDFLISEACDFRNLRGKYNFHIIPMSNPDGVFNGMSRLTWERGLNLDRINWNPGAGPEIDIIKSALDSIRPDVFINFHNWAFKFKDGIMLHDETFAEKFITSMPDDLAHEKKWHIDSDELWCQRNNMPVYAQDCIGWRHYCHDHFGSLGIVFEFPWYGLTTSEMKSKGKNALLAVLATIEKTHVR